MKPISMPEIAGRLGAAWSGGDAMIPALSTDTRDLPEGCLFVALRGDRFDGNDYVAQALERGAAWAVAERLPPGCPAERVLLVPDCRQALLDIAGLYREKLPVTVVAVTGSVGKTTTKEMVACVAQAGFPTLKTQQNLNNEIGLSQTILGLEEEHRVAVLEMGIDGPGQMAPLSRCAKPDIGILTNIGVSHMQQLGSREGIRDEKLQITAGMGEGTTLLLNGDDALLAEVSGLPQRIQRYGIDNEAVDVRGFHVKEYSTHTTFEIAYNGNRFDAQLPSLGRHNVLNALAAFLVGMELGLEPRDAIAALRHYRPAGMRQKVVHHGEFTVVEDCYNASPDSMQAALATLGGLSCDGKRIAVLADMLELGAIEGEAHHLVGRKVAESGIDLLLCTGPLSEEIYRGAREAGMEAAFHFPDKEALFAHLKGALSPGDVAWFKASRAMALEQVIRKVYEEC